MINLERKSGAMRPKSSPFIFVTICVLSVTSPPILAGFFPVSTLDLILENLLVGRGLASPLQKRKTIGLASKDDGISPLKYVKLFLVTVAVYGRALGAGSEKTFAGGLVVRSMCFVEMTILR
jgi:hypothetical protein